jgi:hypothetical protein
LNVKPAFAQPKNTQKLESKHCFQNSGYAVLLTSWIKISQRTKLGNSQTPAKIKAQLSQLRLNVIIFNRFSNDKFLFVSSTGSVSLSRTNLSSISM